jgi:hypothetical protein
MLTLYIDWDWSTEIQLLKNTQSQSYEGVFFLIVMENTTFLHSQSSFWLSDKKALFFTNILSFLAKNIDT